MKKTLIATVSVLLVVLVSSAALAKSSCRKGDGPDKDKPQMRRGMRQSGDQKISPIERLLKLEEELELTEEQITALEAIQEKTEVATDAVKEKKEALHDAVKAAESESTIRSKAAELGTAIGEISVLKVSGKEKVDKILTDEQKTALEELKTERKERRQERMEKRGDRRNYSRRGQHQRGQRCEHEDF